MAQVVKIYGERNTGTNYLTQLLQLNLPTAEVLTHLTVPWYVPHVLLRHAEPVTDWLLQAQSASRLGWKHGVPLERKILHHPQAGQLLVICLIKNPYAFLLSLHRHPYHLRPAIPELQEFLNTRFRSLPRDGYATRTLVTPIEIWNRKHRAYQAFHQQHTERSMLIRYEDLVANTAQVMASIATRLKLPLDGFRQVQASTKSAARDFGYYADYYGQERWRSALSDKHVSCINATLDTELVDQLGYAML